MRASIIGLGVVGCAMLQSAPRDWKITGVDCDTARAMQLGGTHDISKVSGSDLIFVCVGTPVKPGPLGLEQDPSYFLRVMDDLKNLFADRPGFEVVVIRSTILPHYIPTSFPRPIATYPEFLRADMATYDAKHPPFSVIGSDGQAPFVSLRDWINGVVQNNAPLFELGLREAMAVKWALNWFHAAKAEFSNVMLDACTTWQCDPAKVLSVLALEMAVHAQQYLRPLGTTLGGACLPKDLAAGIADLRNQPAGYFLRGIWDSSCRRIVAKEADARASSGD